MVPASKGDKYLDFMRRIALRARVRTVWLGRTADNKEMTEDYAGTYNDPRLLRQADTVDQIVEARVGVQTSNSGSTFEQTRKSDLSVPRWPTCAHNFRLADNTFRIAPSSSNGLVLT
jgi:hypothetical protein